MDFESTSFLESIPKRLPDNAEPLTTFTSFSRQDRMTREDGMVWGGWARSADEACIAGFRSAISEASIIQLRNVSSCPSGSPVTLCEHY